MNLINYSIKKLNVSNHENSVVIINPDATMMSSLTGGQSNSSSSSSTCSNSSKSSKSTELTESAELKSCISVTIEGPSDMNEATTKSTFGRPKGSTVTYYLDDNERIKLATKEAAKQLEVEQQKSKSNKAQLAKGLLDVIITAAKDKYQIPEDLELNKNTIRKRVK